MFEITKELSERINAFLAIRQPAIATINASAAMYCPNTCANNCSGSCRGTCGQTCNNTMKKW